MSANQTPVFPVGASITRTSNFAFSGCNSPPSQYITRKAIYTSDPTGSYIYNHPINYSANLTYSNNGIRTNTVSSQYFNIVTNSSNVIVSFCNYFNPATVVSPNVIYTCSLTAYNNVGLSNTLNLGSISVQIPFIEFSSTPYIQDCNIYNFEYRSPVAKYNSKWKNTPLPPINHIITLDRYSSEIDRYPFEYLVNFENSRINKITYNQSNNNLNEYVNIINSTFIIKDASLLNYVLGTSFDLLARYTGRITATGLYNNRLSNNFPISQIHYPYLLHRPTAASINFSRNNISINYNILENVPTYSYNTRTNDDLIPLFRATKYIYPSRLAEDFRLRIENYELLDIDNNYVNQYYTDSVNIINTNSNVTVNINTTAMLINPDSYNKLSLYYIFIRFNTHNLSSGCKNFPPLNEFFFSIPTFNSPYFSNWYQRINSDIGKIEWQFPKATYDVDYNYDTANINYSIQYSVQLFYNSNYINPFTNTYSPPTYTAIRDTIIELPRNSSIITMDANNVYVNLNPLYYKVNTTYFGIVTTFNSFGKSNQVPLKYVLSTMYPKPIFDIFYQFTSNVPGIRGYKYWYITNSTYNYGGLVDLTPNYKVNIYSYKNNIERPLKFSIDFSIASPSSNLKLYTIYSSKYDQTAQYYGTVTAYNNYYSNTIILTSNFYIPDPYFINTTQSNILSYSNIKIILTNYSNSYSPYYSANICNMYPVKFIPYIASNGIRILNTQFTTSNNSSNYIITINSYLQPTITYSGYLIKSNSASKSNIFTFTNFTTPLITPKFFDFSIFISSNIIRNTTSWNTTLATYDYNFYPIGIESGYPITYSANIFFNSTTLISSNLYTIISNTSNIIITLNSNNWNGLYSGTIISSNSLGQSNSEVLYNLNFTLGNQIIFTPISNTITYNYDNSISWNIYKPYYKYSNAADINYNINIYNYKLEVSSDLYSITSNLSDIIITLNPSISGRYSGFFKAYNIYGISNIIPLSNIFPYLIFLSNIFIFRNDYGIKNYNIDSILLFSNYNVTISSNSWSISNKAYYIYSESIIPIQYDAIIYNNKLKVSSNLYSTTSNSSNIIITLNTYISGRYSGFLRGYDIYGSYTTVKLSNISKYTPTTIFTNDYNFYDSRIIFTSLTGYIFTYNLNSITFTNITGARNIISLNQYSVLLSNTSGRVTNFTSNITLTYISPSSPSNVTIYISGLNNLTTYYTTLVATNENNAASNILIPITTTSKIVSSFIRPTYCNIDGNQIIVDGRRSFIQVYNSNITSNYDITSVLNINPDETISATINTSNNHIYLLTSFCNLIDLDIVNSIYSSNRLSYTTPYSNIQDTLLYSSNTNSIVFWNSNTIYTYNIVTNIELSNNIPNNGNIYCASLTPDTNNILFVGSNTSNNFKYIYNMSLQTNSIQMSNSLTFTNYNNFLNPTQLLVNPNCNEIYLFSYRLPTLGTSYTMATFNLTTLNFIAGRSITESPDTRQIFGKQFFKGVFDSNYSIIYVSDYNQAALYKITLSNLIVNTIYNTIIDTTNLYNSYKSLLINGNRLLFYSMQYGGIQSVLPGSISRTNHFIFNKRGRNDEVILKSINKVNNLFVTIYNYIPIPEIVYQTINPAYSRLQTSINPQTPNIYNPLSGTITTSGISPPLFLSVDTETNFNAMAIANGLDIIYTLTPAQNATSYSISIKSSDNILVDAAQINIQISEYLIEISVRGVSQNNSYIATITAVSPTGSTSTLVLESVTTPILSENVNSEIADITSMFAAVDIYSQGREIPHCTLPLPVLVSNNYAPTSGQIPRQI